MNRTGFDRFLYIVVIVCFLAAGVFTILDGNLIDGLQWFAIGTVFGIAAADE